jgi:putative phosphonate metabolism protein
VSERYALYYAPRPDEGLTNASSQWLGYNPETGRAKPQPVLSGFLPERLAEITAEPRRYGFHGTLKAPIELAEGASEGEFVDAVGRFASSQRPLTVPSMVLAEIGTFLAMIPASQCAELHDLADRCVVEFDEYRRPADAAELAKRRSAGLSPRQDELLQRWGYPYVLEQWRFHLTLSGRVPDEAERLAIVAVLRKHFGGFIDRPLQVRDLCVFRQPAADRPFTVLARFRLGGGRRVSSEPWRAS